MCAALARVFHVVGAKVILAARNLQQLEELKFQLDNEPRKEVGCGCTVDPVIQYLNPAMILEEGGGGRRRLL